MTLRRVRPVPPGGTLRVVAPAGVVLGQALAAPLAALRCAGFDVQLGEHLRSVDPAAPYLAGTDAERARDLEAAFLDPDVDGIVCARGGYGSMRLFESLDPKRWSDKPLVGFSDITAIHGWLATQVGTMSLHGPLLSTLSAHGPTALQTLVDALQGVPPPAVAMEGLIAGRGEGPLVGGNLSLVASLVGTRWFPCLEGAVVFLEEIGEPAYRIDRMISSLMWRGLGRAAAVVVGDVGFTGDRYVADCDLAQAVKRRLLDLLGPLGVPLAWGAPIGHRKQNITVPFGATGRLVVEGGEALWSMEAAVLERR